MACSPASSSSDSLSNSLRGSALFCHLIPSDINSKFPPELDLESRTEYYLNFHTTYPKAKEGISDDDYALVRLKVIYTAAHIALQTSGNQAQAFFCYPQHYIAYRNSDNLLSCFEWTVRLSEYQLKDLATLKFASLTWCKVENIDHCLCFDSVLNCQQRLVALKNLLIDNKVPPFSKRYISVPDQKIALVNQRNPDLLVMGTIAILQDPPPPLSPPQVIQNVVSKALLSHSKLTLSESTSVKDYLFQASTFHSAVKSMINYSSDQLLDIYVEAIHVLHIKHGAPSFFTRTINKIARNFIAFNHPKSGKIDIIQWSGSTIPRSKEVESATSGSGGFCLTQRVRRLATNKVYILKHIRGDYRSSLEFPLRGLLEEVSTVKKIKAIHGKIHGLIQPPLIEIPPQHIYGGIPQFLMGARVEKNYGSALLSMLSYYFCNKKFIAPFLQEFANIIGIVHFLNNTEFWTNNVYHCDIKSDNILCEEDPTTLLPKLTLIDLGHSRSLTAIMQDQTDNLYANFFKEKDDIPLLRQSVELDDRAKCHNIMTAMETNALGRTLREIIGLDPVPAKGETPQQRLIKKANDIGLPVKFYIDVYELTKQMTVSDPMQRIDLLTAKKILLEICASVSL